MLRNIATKSLKSIFKAQQMNQIPNAARTFASVVPFDLDIFGRNRHHRLEKLVKDFFQEEPFSNFFFLNPFNEKSFDEVGGRKNKVEVINTKDKFIISMDVEGFKPEELKVNVVNNVVSIEGKRELKKEEKDGCSHFESVSFNNCYVIPKGVKTEEIQCNIDEGVLKLTAPKIEIKEGEGLKNIPIEFK